MAMTYSFVAVCLAVMLFCSSPAVEASSATITGTVYCDQCLEGHKSMWSLPVDGAKVVVECKDPSSGHVSFSERVTTDGLGIYAAHADGDAKVSGTCTARLDNQPGTSLNKDCSLVGISSRPVTLSWKLFGVSMYSVDALSYKPAKPMSLCPNAGGKTPSSRPPSSPSKSPSSPSHRTPPSPAPAPHHISIPPIPFTKLSACTAQDWLNPQFQCYWRLWSPKTPVELWYGPAAAAVFGANATLHAGLRGSGDVNRVLLRESIAASLNAFNSLAFYYNVVEVDVHFNEALAAGVHHHDNATVMKWAVNFRRANSGYNGHAKCLLTPCSSH